MTLVTAFGLEMRLRCPALTRVIVAAAREAMNSCAAGVMIWSSVPRTYQDGIDFQAGTPLGSMPALKAMGR